MRTDNVNFVWLKNIPKTQIAMLRKTQEISKCTHLLQMFPFLPVVCSEEHTHSPNLVSVVFVFVQADNSMLFH